MDDSIFPALRGRRAGGWGHAHSGPGQAAQCTSPSLHLANSSWPTSSLPPRLLLQEALLETLTGSSSPCSTWHVSDSGSFSLDHDSFTGDVRREHDVGVPWLLVERTNECTTGATKLPLPAVGHTEVPIPLEHP